MKILFGLFLILLTTFFVSCNRTPNLTKDEVYKILNEIIADDSLRLYTVCWQVDNLSVADEYGFSNQDKKFIERQRKVFKDFKFESKRLKFYSRKKKDFDFVYVDTSCKVGILTRLSFPLISADRQRVVIENTEDCHCMLGGQGFKDLYVKQNGHWKRQQSFDRWISQNKNTELRRQIAQQATWGLVQAWQGVVIFGICLLMAHGSRLTTHDSRFTSDVSRLRTSVS
ncbi:MAG: hypothetical protein ABIR30_11350 [Chitinophagaceae bacterium]